MSVTRYTTIQLYLHASDTLGIYDLPKLTNPLWPNSMALEEPAPVLIEGFSIVKGPNTSTSNHQFVKAVPNFLTFSRLWVIYLSLRSSTSPDCDLPVSLRHFYQHVADLAKVFPWEKVAGYVIAICTSRLGKATAAEEFKHDFPLHHLATRDLPSTMMTLDANRSACLGTRGSALAPTSDPAFESMSASLAEVSTSRRLALRTPNLDHQLDLSKPTSFPSTLPPPQSRHIIVRSSSSLILLSDSSQSQLVPVSNPVSQPAPVTPTSSNPLQVLPADLASAVLTSLQTLQPPAQPNTTMAAPLHSAKGLPAHHGSMQAASGNWKKALLNYPDPLFVNQLLGAIKHRVHLGYIGPLRHHSHHQHIKNLPMDDRVGTVPKLHSTKLQTTHYLSDPRLPQPQQLLSINKGIMPHFTTIKYASLAAVLDFVWEYPGCCLWKSDLTDAFRHVVTTLDNARLLGFTFEGRFYMETGLTFRGRSSPWIFNLFAQALLWIVQLATSHPVDHYLDVVPANTDPGQPLHTLALACSALGLQLAPQKTFWNTTKLEILGIEIDTIQQSVGITSKRCLHILDTIDDLLVRHSACLINCQCIAGLLQFISQVVPHGKAYLRRL
ncbi:uncharacterized protein UBRO2_01154 [Ustilago bromivora]|uniref:Reverse transcriptase domain-containing protein n=1 Tax=Ustilago bromivora TaxID=307758 RepID=A0A8H8TQS9_9BASI|nr:uncharacterized protein UBRO2_01154 [Ustilago bromivora]